MKSISLQTVFAEITWKRHQLRNRRLTAMKARIKAGDLRHVWQSLEYRFNCRTVVGLMQWSQRNQFAQFGKDFPGQ